jgi:hypothetical protein
MGLLTGCSARSRSPSLASRGFACDGAVKGQTKTALGTSKRYAGLLLFYVGLTENSLRTARERVGFLIVF